MNDMTLATGSVYFQIQNQTNAMQYSKISFNNCYYVLYDIDHGISENQRHTMTKRWGIRDLRSLIRRLSTI